ncbi:MAG: type II toxin-antitoxin system prevent-host-death family antitoxin [Candidatus Paceibacterota bacterium]|jgi:prevent-host-death family protein
MSTKVKEKIIGLKDLRENADKYINAVAKGRSFTVVRRSKPIFKMMPVDEWGDEGLWETLIDFRDKNGRGIEAGKLLKLIQKIDKK